MLMKISALFPLLVSALAIEADWTVLKADTGYPALTTCQSLVSKFSWGFKKPRNVGRGRYTEICMYPPATGTMLLCAEQYDSHGINKVFDLLASEYCDTYGDYTAKYFEEQYHNASNYVVSLDSIANTSLPMYAPTIPDIEKGRSLYLGRLYYYKNLDSGTYFSAALCGFFLLLIIIGALYNLVRVTGLTKRVGRSKFSKLCQKYIIFPTLIPGGKYAQEYGWKWLSILFPNRIQFLVDLMIFGLHVGFYSAPYHQNEGALFKTTSLAWTRGVSDRSGIMAFGKLPLLILFGGRNNFLLYVTGWSYNTFLHYHKIVALWMCVDILIHSVGYTIYVLGRYTTNLQSTYFACGVAATVLAFVMSGFAYHTLRKHYYEYFLIGHILLGVGFLIMCWYHCYQLGWMEWLVAACSVWVFDRVLRVVRMSGFGYRDATITTVDKELIQIVVKRPAWWTTETGQYGYIYFASIMFWQNHPFTLACKGDEIIGYVKIKNGYTRRLWNQIERAGGKITKKICIEGPYGTIGSGGSKKMDEVLLFTGGSGAPAIIDAAAYLTKGKLFWVVPTLSMAQAYRYLMKDVKVETTIYVTKETGIDGSHLMSDIFGTQSSGESQDDSNSSDDKSSDKEKTLPDSCCTVNIFYHRPNVEEILHDEIQSSMETNVGIVGCGPPGMMDILRNTVAKNVDKYDKSINFYDELQVW